MNEKDLTEFYEEVRNAVALGSTSRGIPPQIAAHILVQMGVTFMFTVHLSYPEAPLGLGVAIEDGLEDYETLLGQRGNEGGEALVLAKQALKEGEEFRRGIKKVIEDFVKHIGEK